MDYLRCVSRESCKVAKVDSLSPRSRVGGPGCKVEVLSKIFLVRILKTLAAIGMVDAVCFGWLVGSIGVSHRPDG